MAEQEYVPVNQETDPLYNQKPGLALIPGSPSMKERAKFEQFHSKFTMGTAGPGNPYVFREFPMMLYRAFWKDGKIACMGAPPDPYKKWQDHTELVRAQEDAQRFTEQCQRVVKDEYEMQRAMEDGWRHSPQDAVDALKAKEEAISTTTAHRNYEDRNMSEGAKAEIKAATEAAGGLHVPTVEEKPTDSPTETIVADGVCNGRTKAGTRCKMNATSGLYCKRHAA